jgi:hypothetical protein
MPRPADSGDAAAVGANGDTSTVDSGRPGPPPVDGGRDLAAAHARLVVDHPDADPSHLAFLLHEAYAATADAKVQTYRILLAERSARARLRRRREITTDR